MYRYFQFVVAYSQTILVQAYLQSLGIYKRRGFLTPF